MNQNNFLAQNNGSGDLLALQHPRLPPPEMASLFFVEKHMPTRVTNMPTGSLHVGPVSILHGMSHP
jgi:hypothetical protein